MLNKTIPGAEKVELDESTERFLDNFKRLHTTRVQISKASQVVSVLTFSYSLILILLALGY